MKKFKKILKYLFLLFIVLTGAALVTFYTFSSPKSDKKVLTTFKELETNAKIHYLKFEGKSIRVVSAGTINPGLPSIIFVHGSIGSSTDFSKYMSHKELRQKANLISYDRLGYGPGKNTPVLNSITKEALLLHYIISEFGLKEVSLVGYSYGGPIALAYALQHKTEKIVLFAPALYSEFEVIPFPIHFYKWELTRPLVPHIWRSASIEKLNHKTDLQGFEEQWKDLETTTIVIHGNEDMIVPLDNSIKLHNEKKNTRLITLEGAGHALIWTRFDTIQKEFLELF
ncbi:alpha/beta hydrolase [Ascidiimonas aurantiaca]|uniref:alpha/beta fold hydrolase n=1 Tax=Ascidiimonas aurantiaca TaxID=1685432 RepID=UPI0030EDC19D